MNMILAGDGHSNIHMQDSLANPTYIDKIKYDKDGKIVRDAEGNIEYSSEYSGVYDVVLANMPYSQKTKHGNLYDLPSTNGDSICVQHCMKAINSVAENGRMALVVPEGFLFRKDLAKTREYLLAHCQLQSIISLPQGVFLPYTGVKTDIIYATNVNKKIRTADKKKDYWYFDVKSDGYTLDNHRRKLETPSDLSRYEEYRKLDAEQSADMMKVGFEVIQLDKVRQNSFILVGSRYRERKVITSEYEVLTIGSVASAVSGYAFPTALQGQEGSLPFYKVSDMNSVGNEIEMHNSNNYVTPYLAKEKKWTVFPQGTVIFPKIGAAIATNKKRILSIPAIFDNNVMGLVCGERIIPKYLFYLLSTIDISKWASLSNPPSITKDMVLDEKIPLPSIEKQELIVAELDGYQNIIRNAAEITRIYRPIIHFDKAEYKMLEEISAFTPSKDEIKDLPNDTVVSFVPMADINTFNVCFDATGTRVLSEVLSGFTYFRNGDILLAKITPCFENGKAGIARNLVNGVGFGSTEYIVIRANTDIVYPEWIFYHVNTSEFIAGGKPFMTGTAGQQRIDLSYVKQHRIPVPPLEEQKAILDEILAEQSLIKPAKELIEVFTSKTQNRIKEVWGE